jgi:hypothetical protein
MSKATVNDAGASAKSWMAFAWRRVAFASTTASIDDGADFETVVSMVVVPSTRP